MPGCHTSALQMTPEEQERFLETFSLDGKLTIPGRRLFCCSAWYRPACWERRPRGALLYRILGAGLLRQMLKASSCYPRPIAGTRRESPERERSLILTVALTVQYESSHRQSFVWHIVIALIVFTIMTVTIKDKPLLPAWVLIGHLAFNWFLNVLPILVQRLNRGRIFWTIAEMRHNRAAQLP